VELLLDPVHYGGLVLNWLSLLVVLFGRKEATLDKSCSTRPGRGRDTNNQLGWDDGW